MSELQFPLTKIQKEALAVWRVYPKKPEHVRPADEIDLELFKHATHSLVQGWTGKGDWWNFGIVYGRKWVPPNANAVPHIRDFIYSHPDRSAIDMVGISFLDPGGSIPAHTDEPHENKTRSRVDHYGLFGSGKLRVKDEVFEITPGSYVSFDDKEEHEAWNTSKELPRAILYMKFVF